jgi:hypothetical protein
LTLSSIYDIYFIIILFDNKKRCFMVIKTGFFRQVGITLIAAFILSSCSAAQTPSTAAIPAASPTPLPQNASSTEVPTNTPAATATTALVATNTPSPAPTATLTAPPTVAATANAASSLTAQVVPTTNPYCRKGPGYGYNAITFLLSGTAYNVIGRDSLNSWWQVQAPGNVNCWVADAYVTKQGPVEQVSIVRAQPLPGTPAQFVNSYVCDTSKKTLTVALNWAAVDYVTGYHIYRDGNQVAELGPTATSYGDNAPRGENVVYELEAFNDYGVAPRIATNVPACK